MAKQRKQFFMVLILLGIVLVIYAAVISYNRAAAKREESQKEAETIYVTDIKTEEVTSFSYNCEEDTYRYTKTENGWTYEEDTSMKLDEATIENMLTAVKNLTAEESVDTYDSLDVYGLVEPEKTITLTTETDSCTLRIGSYNEIVGWYYLMKEGDALLYLVDSDILSTFDVTPQDFEVEETETDEISE